MHICPSCGAQYGAWLSRCGRCHYSPLLNQEAIMAKITRHGGPSDAHDPDRPDTLLGPTDGGNPATGPQEDAGAPEAPDTPGTDTEGSTDEPGPASDDASPEPTTPDPNLPGVNALKTVWEEALLALGFSPGWVYAEGRTKEQLIEHGRGVADGSLRLNDSGEPEPAPTEG